MERIEGEGVKDGEVVASSSSLLGSKEFTFTLQKVSFPTLFVNNFMAKFSSIKHIYLSFDVLTDSSLRVSVKILTWRLLLEYMEDGEILPLTGRKIIGRVEKATIYMQFPSYPPRSTHPSPFIFNIMHHCSLKLIVNISCVGSH